MRKETRKRLKGVKELAVTAARRNPVVDEAVIAKEVFDSTYRVVKGREPPSWGERIDRMFARRERRFNRRFGK